MGRAATGSERTLTERAFEIIKGAILRGDIEEGSLLSYAEVKKKYGIGRTPFREACIRLQHEGLLESLPRRGYLVPEVSFRTLREMLEARVTLESAVAELAALKAKPAQIKELDRLAKRSWTSGHSNRDLEKLVRANSEFHLCLARMTQNTQLIRLLKWVLEQAERLSYLELLGSRAPRKEIQALHKPIVEAIRRRDPAAAKRAVVADISQGQLDLFGKYAWPLTGRK